MTEDAGPHWSTLPPKVAAALNQVMRGVQKLGKDERNPFANYQYAGIESFLEMVRPLCAEAGLLILQEEEFYEFIHSKDAKDKDITWLVMSFLFGLAHSSGETWSYRMRRTGMVQASMGSQAFGAAQSYALKSFLRSIGLIATGDTEDADSHAQRDLPTAYGIRQDKKLYAEVTKEVNVLIAEINAAQTVNALDEWGFKSRARVHKLPDSWQAHLRNEFNRRKTEIEEGVTEDGSEIKKDSEFKRQARASLEEIDDEIPETNGGDEAA
jgi:hypothetical protein